MHDNTAYRNVLDVQQRVCDWRCSFYGLEMRASNNWLATAPSMRQSLCSACHLCIFCAWHQPQRGPSTLLTVLTLVLIVCLHRVGSYQVFTLPVFLCHSTVLFLATTVYVLYAFHYPCRLMYLVGNKEAQCHFESTCAGKAQLMHSWWNANWMQTVYKVLCLCWNQESGYKLWFSTLMSLSCLVHL